MSQGNGLKFSDPNDKSMALKSKGIVIKTISIPAGHTCPGAALCRARVGREAGLRDPKMGIESLQIRGFAASDEAQYKPTREQRWHNFDALRAAATTEAMAELISSSLPKKATHIRIHVSGDFFNASYFLAWCQVAREHPSIV